MNAQLNTIDDNKITLHLNMATKNAKTKCTQI